jgi:hypothetical protein
MIAQGLRRLEGWISLGIVWNDAGTDIYIRNLLASLYVKN